MKPLILILAFSSYFASYSQNLDIPQNEFAISLSEGISHCAKVKGGMWTSIS